MTTVFHPPLHHLSFGTLERTQTHQDKLVSDRGPQPPNRNGTQQ